MRVSNSLDPDQDQRWVQTVCKGYQQTTKVATSGERVKIILHNKYSLVLSKGADSDYNHIFFSSEKLT